MNVMAIAFNKPLLEDRVEVSRGGAVVENFRRRARRVAEINFHRVTLPRPNLQPVGAEFETLLVVFGDDLLQHLECEWLVGGCESFEKFVDAYPPTFLQLDADGIWPMPQDITHALADFFELILVHSLSSTSRRQLQFVNGSRATVLPSL